MEIGLYIVGAADEGPDIDQQRVTPTPAQDCTDVEQGVRLLARIDRSEMAEHSRPASRAAAICRRNGEFVVPEGASMLGGSGASTHFRAVQPNRGSLANSRFTKGENITITSASSSAGI